MPDREQSTPAPIPHLDPAAWEDHQGFRETLLLHFTKPAANATLRGLGGLLFDLALEHADLWPDHPEGSTRSELRAALADLRHLQGFLAAVGREHAEASLSSEDVALSQFAAQQALEVGMVGDRIEGELARARPA